MITLLKMNILFYILLEYFNRYNEIMGYIYQTIHLISEFLNNSIILLLQITIKLHFDKLERSVTSPLENSKYNLLLV